MKESMTLGQRLADQIRRSHNGDAWHGPSLAEIPDGVTHHNLYHAGQIALLKKVVS